MLQLAIYHVRCLKARAHALNPVVYIGAAGLSERVVHELDQALRHHELIKVKVLSDQRERRNALLEEICLRVKAVPIQHIGKMLVIYRPESANTTEPASTSVGNERKPRAPRQAKRKQGRPRIER